MLRNTSQKRFMKLARDCYFIVCCVTILNEPETFHIPSLPSVYQPGDLELMQEHCPDLFSLAGFYLDAAPLMSSSLIMSTCAQQAQDELLKFLKSHHDACIDLKHTIYAWLSIPEHKRIRQLSKGLVQVPGSLLPLEAAAELDSRVRRLEISWVNKG